MSITMNPELYWCWIYRVNKSVKYGAVFDLKVTSRRYLQFAPDPSSKVWISSKVSPLANDPGVH